MGFLSDALKKKNENEQLEDIITDVKMNMSNNYKDATQKCMVKLEETYDTLRRRGDLTDKQMVHYAEVLDELKEQTKGFFYNNKAATRGRW